jgi:hypothetical protein
MDRDVVVRLRVSRRMVRAAQVVRFVSSGRSGGWWCEAMGLLGWADAMVEAGGLRVMWWWDFPGWVGGGDCGAPVEVGDDRDEVAQ